MRRSDEDLPNKERVEAVVIEEYGPLLYLITLMDDLLMVGKSIELMDWVQVEVSKLFQISEVEGCDYFLGMEIGRKSELRTLKLTQRKQIKDILERFMAWARLGFEKRCVRDEERLDIVKCPYSELVERLLYLTTCTRPNLYFTMRVLSRYMAEPTVEQEGTVDIKEDNQGALKLLKHSMASKRSKHIDIMHHFEREQVMRDEVKFEYCPIDKMLADFMTKVVPA
ncbi:hypothetical protein AXG93_4368s1040 [Marchantia polymorpha subsp. ruderalis]|uniref:Reverse transcriptase Ty1/copia-type domain-containing protein n=1 Tax=Marchantia polymorpha subsp. ruderalis TaxID=1480154 RepID=A0A176VZL6_MARPO|nr:hypothetical protein AXG93_4368s1040 [Marchantia polymorpha subsp. ruderalis]